MRNYIISTESNADLSKEFIKENDICVIPHYYSIEEDYYGGEKELPIEEFYQALREKKKAATMASNPAVILDKFRDVVSKGNDILFISFSSALSSGYNNIINGAEEIMEEFPESKIIVIDSLSASIGEKILIIKALEYRSQGKSIEETASLVEEIS